MTQPADLTATAMLAGYRDGSLSPVDVLASVSERITAAEPTCNALWLCYADELGEAARESENRWRAGDPCGPLDGVPVTLKDNIATRGVPVPVGSAATELVPAAADAPAAARVREAGALLVGKTTMPDFGMLTSGLSSFHTLARNPWNPAWNPGGSSAGAGAAAAAGYGPLHVGTDIGGSVRLPAGWCATAGLKPSGGRVPVDPPYYGRTVGPLTRTVADSALLMAVLSAPDGRDFTSLPPADLAWTALDGDVRGRRVGLLTDAGAGLPTDPEVRAAVLAAAAVFERGGAVVEPVEPFVSTALLAAVDTFWRVRAWVDFSALPPERQRLVLPFYADWSRPGAEVPGPDVVRCVNAWLALRKAAVTAIEPFDLMLSPVAPVPTYAAEAPCPTGDPATALEHIAYTVPYNFSEQPAASVNCGFTADGRPIGLQVIGRRFDDTGVLRAAAWYEGARGADATPDWSRLAV